MTMLYSVNNKGIYILSSKFEGEPSKKNFHFQIAFFGGGGAKPLSAMENVSFVEGKKILGILRKKVIFVYMKKKKL